MQATSCRSAVRLKRSKKLQQSDLDLVKTSAFEKSWYKATESSVLILSGSPFDIYETALFLCWLSYHNRICRNAAFESGVEKGKNYLLTAFPIHFANTLLRHWLCRPKLSANRRRRERLDPTEKRHAITPSRGLQTL